MKNTYLINMSDEDNSMHLSKDGGPTICTDFHAAAGLADFLRLCEDANIGASSREPKADPKEKELYSIKRLEWTDGPIASSTMALGFEYRVTLVRLEEWHCGLYVDGKLAEVIKGKCPVVEYGKRLAQDHFNSKLKLCLNREL